MYQKKIELKDLDHFHEVEQIYQFYWNYLTFILNSLYTICKYLTFKKNDVIFIFCPSPILSALPAILINKLFNKKIVIWVLDLWPDTIIDLKIVKINF